MKTISMVSLLAVSAALFATGCASPKTTYVDSDSSRLIANVDEINLQDFATAADQMTQSLIEDCLGELEGTEGEKPLIAVSKIVNDTNTQFQMDLLVKRIRTALTKTKMVNTTTTLNLGASEDPLAKQNQLLDEAIDESKTPLRPDYTLSGKIIELTTRTSNLRQSSYEFQLSLSDRRGVVIWEDLKTITKQGKKPSVGF